MINPAIWPLPLVIVVVWLWNMAAPRFRTLLLAIFASLAASLAMAGVCGVLS